MGVKSSLRSALMQATLNLRIDQLALWLQSRRALNSPRMIVVEMHETPTRLQAQFHAQLEWVARHFTLLDPAGFERYWKSPSGWPDPAKPPVLFTFDDGRLSNYLVAAPMLESFGAAGVFFVIPEWAECNSRQSREFYYSRIDPHPVPDHSHEDWTSMTPAQMAELARRGHAIGSHTYSHVRLTGLASAQLQHQIVDSAVRIASWTGQPAKAFAWTLAWDSITREAWELIRDHYDFCFAPCPGTVSRSDSPHLIWRNEIEVRYPASEYRFMYSGLVNALWQRKRNQLRKILFPGLAKS